MGEFFSIRGQEGMLVYDGTDDSMTWSLITAVHAYDLGPGPVRLFNTPLITDASGRQVVCEFLPTVAGMRGAALPSVQRSSKIGLDYFGARYFSAAQGRFTSPDKPFADQHIANPQSWNLYSYTRNNPLSSVDPDGQAVTVMTDLALQRIQSTVPKEVRSQVRADKGGVLNKASIDAIKSTDPNVAALKQAVDADKTIEVTTGSAVKGGGPDGIVGLPFSYESVADQTKAFQTQGIDTSGMTLEPNVYDGFTQTAAQSPSGNVRVTLADGQGATATEPAADLSSVTAHELYGHAVPMVQGKPYGHDNGGPVDKTIKKIEDHTKELNKNQ